MCVLPSPVSPACGIYLQSSNIRYLDSSQLTLFNISDQCTTTCSDGYYGDFCQDLSQYANLPMGPWNQAGYCTSGPAILRSMTIDVSAIRSIQYTKKDSVLIGISNAGLGDQASVVYEIFLYSRVISPVLRPTPAGSLNALLVRKGVVYVARTVRASGVDKNDIVVLAGPNQPQPLMSVDIRVITFDVCVDKGTVTAFVYSSNSIRACYPSGTCNIWVSSINTVSGMIIGADCQKTLYVSSLANILKVTSVGSTLLRSSESTVYCLTGIPDINVLLYKSRDSMWQINLGTGSIQTLPLGVTQTQEMQCSADVSEKSNQILIVQNGIISTLEAVQEPCAFGRTSQALLCNSTAQCTACPPPPTNAYRVEGSVSCEWVCRAGFKQMGSKCVSPVPLPCPAYYTISPDSSGMCTPSVLPWADQGKYAEYGTYSTQQLFPTANLPIYMLVSEGQALIHAVPGQFYLSLNGGMSWVVLSFANFAAANCYSSSQNSYYYLNSRQGILWTAFTQQRPEGLRNCLWKVNATDAIASRGTRTLNVLRAWTLDRQLCSMTGEINTAYAILCGNNYVSRLQSDVISPLIGDPLPGYADGVFQAARFSTPSSITLFDSRLYIADTGNCVIREADMVLGVVTTVAGTAGTCLRSDGVGSAATLTYPAILSYTAYDGILLFLDRNSNGQFAYVRQFHTETSTVSTIKASPFAFSQISSLAASQYGVVVSSQRGYYVYSASQLPCPNGTTSLAGNAYSASGCVACLASFYSNAAGCKPCSSPTCSLPGQLFVPCQLNADAYCGSCTNKPAGASSKYVGASSIPGQASGGGDCAWVYTAPCPVGYYKSTDDTCVICPPWSTTANTDSKSLSDCFCLGNGQWVAGECVIPSPFASSPALCHPLTQCAAYVEPASIFPILPACTSFDVDSRVGVCPCQPGEYIQQIYPKKCTACPSGLYSPDGKMCRVCPYLTEPSADRTSCRCIAGTTDVALTLPNPQCVCGPGKAFDSSVGCTPCPENTYSNVLRCYNAPMQTLQCTPCPVGTWAPSGSTSCAACPLGQYRGLSDSTCQSCSHGSYAPDPAVSLCVDCVSSCFGRRETQCATDRNLYMCSDCPAPRANSAFNGKRDCATSCDPGFYEADGECVRCTEYYKTTCPTGNRFVECSSYADAGCVACVNSSMPLNFAVWSYRADEPNGPSLACEWECEEGYSPQRPPLPGGIEAEWECVKAGEWSVWDLFTL